MFAASARHSDAASVAPEPKPLNNLVSELLNVSQPASDFEISFDFTNPRDGWVWVSGTFRGKQPLKIWLDGQELPNEPHSGTLEAMRFLAKGRHGLRRQTDQPIQIQSLRVHAIPELAFANFGANPHVPEFGKYDWPFLKAHVLANINVMVGYGTTNELSFVKQWKAMGRRWIMECGVPGLSPGAKITGAETEKSWLTQPGITEPLLDGVIADEFVDTDPSKYAAWTEAVQNMSTNPALAGKRFYPYFTAPPASPTNRAFLKAVMDAGWPVAWERYLSEPRDDDTIEGKLDRHLRKPIAAWRQAMPGIEQHLIVCLGTFSLPPESLDVSPSANYKVFLDQQMNLLATDPAFAGLYGVMSYLSAYTDEETIRWMSRLFRHYCIEGKTNLLSTDPYLLTHISNSDFEDGLKGWMVNEAEPGSVAARKMDGFSWLQGRYPRTPRGNSVLWMKRSLKRPNFVSQKIQGLNPGRLYSLRMYSGDFQDLAVERKHAIAIKVSGADVLPEKSFQHVFANCYSHRWGPFDDKHRAWMNYHWVIFRATHKQALLRISDWASEQEPGGPAGQELMMNFVQVQPYLD